MAFIVEMVRGQYGEPPTDCFSCGDKLWGQVLELGRQAGWSPAGTAPDPESKEAWDEFGRFEDNYEPDEWLYAKLFQESDAAALAEALETIINSDSLDQRASDSRQPLLLRDDMTVREILEVNADLSVDFLRRFTTFLRGGAFAFAWDD